METLSIKAGILTPFGNIEGLYFNNSSEPDEYMFDFKQDVRKVMENEDCEYIEIQADTKEEYYRILNELSQFNENALTVTGTPREKYQIIDESSDEDIDESSDNTNEESGDENGN